MTAARKYKQLKFSMDPLKDHYDAIALRFKLHHQVIKGALTGNYQYWFFKSESPAFLKHIPSGILFKYAIWENHIPTEVSNLYNAIWEAAFKAGYDLQEKEELV